MILETVRGTDRHAGPAPLPPQPRPQPLAIDSHAHIFHRGLALASDRRYAPDYDAPLGAYLNRLDQAGLSHGVLIQPSFLGTDNRFLLEGVARAGGRLRGVAVLAPGAMPAEWDALSQGGIVGLRLNLIGQPLPDFRTLEWRGHLREIARRGWHVELQAHAGDLPALLPVLAESGAPLVVDHFGLPDPARGVADPGFEFLCDFAASADLWVKLSGPYRLGDAVVARERSAAAGRALIDRIGPARLIWGSDWPHTRFEGEQRFGMALALLARLVPDPVVRGGILGANAARLFGFPLSGDVVIGGASTARRDA